MGFSGKKGFGAPRRMGNLHPTIEGGIKLDPQLAFSGLGEKDLRGTKKR